jgi:hypothetical protein
MEGTLVSRLVIVPGAPPVDGKKRKHGTGTITEYPGYRLGRRERKNIFGSTGNNNSIELVGTV